MFDCRKILLSLRMSALVLFVLPGCATIYTQNYSKNDNDVCETCMDVSRIYSGTAYDLCYIASGSPMMLYNVIDLPFSFVADTILLPFTVYQQHDRGSICIEPYIDSNAEEN